MVRVVPVRVLDDNYAYLIIDDVEKQAAAVDPVEPAKLLEAAKQEGVTITMILTTHKHWDHAGGNLEIAKLLPSIPIIGGEKEKVPGCTDAVKNGDTIMFGNLAIKCMETPFHTSGHVCYGFSEGDDASVITGDTLFVGGCGRFFEGDAKQACQALVGTLAKLPQHTKVWCGHEYTMANLLFARTLEPNNGALLQKINWAKKQIAEGKFTVPSTIGDELNYNPFLRVHEVGIQDKCGTNNITDTMAAVREKKDKWTCPPM
mmetsp:Transcript_30546/g.51462  ORF Transcript_30546/g.51462 Transcript_30546/m.51462 type:complete len:260 (-) Transcript_30546:826-1605(-)|eukprot:CAMPEP_0198230918 /NCGR_PEP_ID=MMETSP1445-20131203/114924_1 /TAXON_ID=36898 /ORGANISM="Pyramimonas sp., Strain CCMP2087" /LENGTH=259 /DNA_ID=CAMNT_0043911499 /DNA_START=57 /DNA_END=836 /DNA_ORIENTATION=-